MRPQDYGKPFEKKLQSLADWAVFEALTELMGDLVNKGKYADALIISQEIERYLRGEGWSWNDE